MKIKNTILTAVCICFLCLLGSMQVYAAEYYGNFQYEDNGENVSIYAYNGSDKEVTIPAYINGKAVTEINDYAFLLCNTVERIIVPSTVTTIHTNAFSGAGNLKDVVLASTDTKIEDSNENVDKKDTDGSGKSNPSGTSNDQAKEQSGVNNNQSNYKVTVDSSLDTATEEKKLAEQYKKENKTDDGATAQNRGTEKQSGGTEIAGIDEGIDADENTIGSNADTVSEKSQSIPVRGIILTVVLAAIAVSGTVLFIRKKKKQK